MSLFPDLPIENNEPVFKEPWEAQAFSLVIALHEKGVFSWDEWSEALAKAIHWGPHQAGENDVVQRVGEGLGGRMGEKGNIGDSYYQHWLAALEHLAVAKGLSEADELAQRVQAWREAYLATPHGQPVELANN
ncbi:MAG: nitrile hydratase accessory protein [Gammaproteobacteria bacterium]|nr:nitrile hydratase accessory protein [Gammaproteobacteria bacterium]